MRVRLVFKAGLLGVSAMVLSMSGAGMVMPASVSAAQAYQPRYVAFGDSITTGSSIATCQDNRVRSPWGCAEGFPLAMPYPDRVAQALRLSFSDRLSDYLPGQFNPRLDLYRAGIWGYTVAEAVSAQRIGHNEEGRWIPQLEAINQATRLVTGSLGINDLHFSDVAKWAGLYLKPGADHITPAVQAILAARSGDFNQLFTTLENAKNRGVRVDVTLYYNPYDSPGRLCADLKTIGDRIINALDDELAFRARAAHVSVTDFRFAFQGHGAGSPQPYVFGSKCKINDAVSSALPAWIGGGGGTAAVSRTFDPHPNALGTAAMANQVLGEVGSAD